MLEKIFDPILGPLLNLGYFWAILILSFVLTILITVIYKYTTDQELMKKLKGDMKKLQKEAKQYRDKPKKAMAIQKQIMEKNMKYMKHSLKPTLYTFIPLIIIFGWMNANLSYLPIEPDTQFSIMAEFKEGTFGDITLEYENLYSENRTHGLVLLKGATQEIGNGYKSIWSLEGSAGEYKLRFIFDNVKYPAGEDYISLIISTDGEYANPENIVKNSYLKKITIMNEKVRPLESTGLNINWLWTYILLSLIFSFSLRKLMKLS